MTGHPQQEQISALLDRQLEAHEAVQVELHLGHCESCRQLHEELALTNRLFRELEAAQAPHYLWTRVAAELTPPSRHRRFAWLSWWSDNEAFRRLLPAAAGVAVLVLIGGAVALFQHHSNPPAEVAVLAQIDEVHASLAARNLELYNPFHTAAQPGPDSNPFTRGRIGADSNPFESLRGKHR